MEAKTIAIVGAVSILAVGGFVAFVLPKLDEQQRRSRYGTGAAAPMVPDISRPTKPGWYVTLEAVGDKGFDPYPVRQGLSPDDARRAFDDVAEEQQSDGSKDSWRGIDMVAVRLWNSAGNEEMTTLIQSPYKGKAKGKKRARR